MSLDKIQKLVSSLTKEIEDNYKIATPILSVKLSKYLNIYPYDQTIGMVSRVIEKMASNNKLFICRADLKELYNKLYSNNTKFADLFKDELGIINSLPEPTLLERDDSLKEINIYEIADPILANALNSVFDKTLPLKMYSQKLATKAKEYVTNTLDSWGLKPTSLDICDGSDKFLLVKADYETPKGITGFYIPVEIHNNQILDTPIFIGNTGLQDLNHKNIKQYITTNAGSKLKTNASAIMDILTKSASERKEISGVELALTKLHATRQGKSDFFGNQIVGQKVAEASIKDVEIPRSNEFLSFEKQFTNPVGLASFKFGSDKIKIATDNILRELTGFGYKNSQIAIADHNDNTIFYSISLDAGKVAFMIPVKIVKGKINKPTMILCNGSALSFDREGINNLYINNQSDYKAAAVASPLFNLKPSELINSIREAMVEKNYVKAEDTLNVLANSGDNKAYATGFQIFLQGIGENKEASKQCKCNMIIRNSSSQYPICGHTGLPIHKTYQDEYGSCRPLYRRGISETYEGASFMNAKIFG